MKNKKLFYQLIFISIFLINLISSIKPVVGYEMGIPEQAKGVEVCSQVKIYDKDEWDDHLGSGAMDPDELFDSKNADKVGAKSKTRIIDWEESENNIDFFEDYILSADTEIEGVPEVETFNDALDYLNKTLKGFVILEGESPVLLAYFYSIFSTPAFWGYLEPGSLKDEIYNIAEFANKTCCEYSIDADYAHDKYAEKFDGTIIKIDVWKSTTEEFNDIPDKKEQEAPILKDPSAWYKNYERLNDLREELIEEVNMVIETCEELEASLATLKLYELANWTAVNSTLGDVLVSSDIDLPSISEGGDDLPFIVMDAALNPTGLNPIQDGLEGLLSFEPTVRENLPEKFGFLYSCFLAGLPTYKPVEKYLKEIINDFDIDEEDLEIGIPGLNPNLQVRGDVELNGRVVTLKFRYPEGTVDPDDPDKELEDFEVQITYAGEGSSGSLIFKDGDEIFYEREGLPFDMVIYGYPIYIIITVGTVCLSVFVISLIYVISKKRQNKI